jgi:hypothetical protein
MDGIKLAILAMCFVGWLLFLGLAWRVEKLEKKLEKRCPK